jgi:membrane fusion protein (multidrug efflux system)
MRDFSFVRRHRGLFIRPILLLAIVFASAELKSAAPEDHGAATRPANAPAFSVPGTLEGRTVDIRPVSDGAIRQVNCLQGQAVRRGEVLFQLDDAAAQAQVDAAKAEFQLADNRARGLENAPKGTFSEQERNILMAQRQVAASNLVVKLSALEQTRLVAPFAGVILRSDAIPGQVAPRGVSIATVIEVRPLKVRFSVSQDLYDQLQLGQEAGIYQRNARQRVAGARISFISPEFDPATATAMVKADVEDADARLKPGMNVTVGSP